MKLNRIFALLTFALLFFAQFVFAGNPLEKAKFSFSYEMQSNEGTNGSAVVWVPDGNYYVTCIAGNADFPLEAFDRSGKSLYAVPVGIDIRGMWYNPKTKRLEANGAGDAGWYERIGATNGKPDGEWKLIVAGQNHPDFQSVLSYIPKKKKLVTYYDGNFSFWGRKNQKQKLRFQHGTPFGEKWFIDPTTACYTGNDDFPIAILELNAGKILYFDLKGKYLAGTLVDGTDDISAFRFSFANGKAFIFDAEARIWNAFDVFE